MIYMKTLSVENGCCKTQLSHSWRPVFSILRTASSELGATHKQQITTQCIAPGDSSTKEQIFIYKIWTNVYHKIFLLILGGSKKLCLFSIQFHSWSKKRMYTQSLQYILNGRYFLFIRNTDTLQIIMWQDSGMLFFFFFKEKNLNQISF